MTKVKKLEKRGLLPMALTKAEVTDAVVDNETNSNTVKYIIKLLEQILAELKK